MRFHTNDGSICQHHRNAGRVKLWRADGQSAKKDASYKPWGESVSSSRPRRDCLVQHCRQQASLHRETAATVKPAGIGIRSSARGGRKHSDRGQGAP